MLLGKLDCDKYLAPKIKHARTLAQDSAAFIRAFCTIAFFRALEALRIGLPDPVTSASLMMLQDFIREKGADRYGGRVGQSLQRV